MEFNSRLMLGYFKGIRTVEALKTEYRKLCMLNHPDRGGDSSVMRSIIDEYKELLTKGFHMSYNEVTEEITVEDVDSYFDDVADVMDYEEMDFVDLEQL
jgi:hypothetical protein